MTQAASPSAPEAAAADKRLPILLAMAMFVLVVDTSIMNVSISAVVADLGTSVSSIQSAIALEALVSAAFILIGSKVGDLIGRKRAYILGLLAYAIGALAMALGQSIAAIIIFWAIIGGLGASLLLPAMQSLIHGNFEGAAQKATYALVGAAAAIAAAVGPLIGGFITTFLSYRVAFMLEVVVIAIVLVGSRLVREVPYTGSREVDVVGAVLSVLGMGGLVLGILAWQEGGEAVGLLLAIGAVALAAFAWWLVRRKRQGKATLIDPDLFKAKLFRFGISGQLLQNVALGGAMITIPIYLQMVLEYNALQAGISLAPLSLSMFAAAILAGKRSGNRRPSSIIRAGFAAPGDRPGGVGADRAAGGRRLVPRHPAGDRRDRAGPARVPAQQLHPVADRGGARQRGRGRELGRGLLRAVVRTGVRRRHHAGVAVARVHQPGRVEHGALAGRAAAGRGGPQRGRGVHDQHRPRRADRQPAARRRGRDHPHQHRGAADRAPDRAADPDHRQPAGAGGLVPHGSSCRIRCPPARPKGLPWAEGDPHRRTKGPAPIGLGGGLRSTPPPSDMVEPERQLGLVGDDRRRLRRPPAGPPRRPPWSRRS